MRRNDCFGTGIVWGTIPSGFPVFWVAVPGCSPNGYGTSPNLRIQKKFIKVRQSTQNTRHRPAEFFRKFFSYSPFDLCRNLGDVFLSHFWIKCVLWLTVLCIFRRFSRNCRYFSFFPSSCQDTEGKVLSAVKTELKFYFYNNSVDVLLLWGKSFNEDKTANDLNKKYNTRMLQNYIILIVLWFLLFVLFPWRET